MTETPAPARKRAAPKNPRRRARELALQGLYQWLVGGTDFAAVDAHMREQPEFEPPDTLEPNPPRTPALIVFPTGVSKLGVRRPA